MAQEREELFPENLLHRISEMRNNKELCDFVIEAEGVQFRVHKVVLAASSGYFKAMLMQPSKESSESKVCIQNIDSTTMKVLLDFIYTAQLHIDEDNVQDILVASSFLQIDSIRNICTRFMKKTIELSNCLAVLSVAYQCDFDELYRYALKFCLDQFMLVVREKQFLELDEHILITLISNDQLNVEREEEVTQAVFDWIEADKDARVPKLESIMKHIRLSFIEPVTLVEMTSRELVKQSRNCIDLINEAKDFILLKEHPELQSRMSGSKFQARLPQRKLQRIYSLGGWSNDYKPMTNVEKYDPYLDEWTEVSSMKTLRFGVGAVVLDDFLYAIGGHDGQDYLKSSERFNVVDETWHSDVADMKYERTVAGVVALNGYIYAVSGQECGGPSNIIEKYDPKTNTWQECKRMNICRIGAGIAVLDGCIYAIGGSNDDGLLNCGEYYDPVEDKWTKIASMATVRKHMGCTSYGGKIYAVGGRSEFFDLESAECYDPKTDTWEFIPSMSTRRSGIGLVELDDFLYAIGGHSGDKRLKLVEVYDPINQTWSIKSSMIHERLGGGLAVHSTVRDFKNPKPPQRQLAADLNNLSLK